MDVQLDESPKSRRATGSTLLRMIKKQAQRSPHQHVHRQASLHDPAKRRSTIVRADSFNKAISDVENNVPIAKPPSVNRDVEEFQRYHKDVKSAVRYFRIVVEKKIVSKVPDNISILLESVINIDNMLNSCLKLQATKGLEELRKTMQSCISKLVKWGDIVLLKTSASLDIEKGMDMLNCLEKSIQELHDSAIPRLQKACLNRQIRESVLLLKPEDMLQGLKSEAKNDSKPKLSKSHSDGNLKGVLEQAKMNGTTTEGNRRDSGISERSVNSDHSSSTTSESPPTTNNFKDSGTCLSDGPGITSVEDSPLAVTAWSPGLKSLSDELPGSPLSPAPPRGNGKREVKSCVVSSSSNRTITTKTTQLETTEYSVKKDKVTAFYQESQKLQHRTQRVCDCDTRTESSSSFGSTLERESMDLSDSQSIEELDTFPEMPVRQTYTATSPNGNVQFLGSTETTTSAKKKSFQVYIQVLGEYTKPSPEYLERTMSVNSVYDNYQDMRNFTIEKMANALQSSGEKTGTTLITTKIPLTSLQNNSKQPTSPIGDARKAKSLDYRSFPKLKKNSPTVEEPKPVNQPTAIAHANSESSLSSGDEECTPPLDSLDVAKFLVFRDEPSGQILYGGVADALIVHATNSSKKDYVFSEAFLMTYRAFMTSFDLIYRLIYREHRMKEKGHKRASQNAFLLLLRVIDDLVAPIPKNILDILIKETHYLFSSGHLTFGKQVRDRIIPKSEMQYHNQDSITFATPDALEHACSIFSFHSEDIAKQLTIQDNQYFSRIEIPEILSWGKAQNEDLAPNLAIFTEHFNQVSYWCRTYLLSFEKSHDREKVYNKFLKIMKFLRKYNNFNSLLAIFSALDSSAVRRLDFPKTSTDTLAQFSNLIESEGSFRIYRAALADAKPPCVPYLGLILQDVTFTYIGNADELPDGKVNFYKCWQLFQMLEEFKKFRISKYEFDRDPKIMAFFGGFQNHLSEDELYDRSLQLKPRDR